MSGKLESEHSEKNQKPRENSKFYGIQNANESQCSLFSKIHLSFYLRDLPASAFRFIMTAPPASETPKTSYVSLNALRAFAVKSFF